jgi:acetyl-CoA C-acetyltransferase
MKRVAIVGIGTLPWRSRYADKSFRALGLEATKKALQDAGIPKEEIDNVVYSIYCETMLRQQIATPLLQDYIGTQGTSTLRVTAGAAGSGYALSAAFAQIASGMSEITLYLAVQKGQDFYAFDTRSRGDGILRGFSISMDTTWLQPVSPGVPPFLTLFCLIPHIEKYGGPSSEQLAKVSVKNYKNAYSNPEAQLHQKITTGDVLNSRIISWPTTARMCCLYSEGACAFILASEDKAREITDKPIWITGMATSSYALHRAEANTLTGSLIGTQIAAKKAYEMAGIKKPIDDLDIIQVHDLITGTEILAYEALGLCEMGEGGRLVDEGMVERNGKIPSNTDGGRIACGHVGGVSGAYAVCEIVRQLREEASDRQIKIDSGRGLMQCIDGHASLNSVAIFERGE